MRYFVVAGENSGDLHGARLITSLKERDPEAEFQFVGGDRMAEASGVAPLVHCEEIAVMGFASVLARFRGISHAGKKMQKGLLAFSPDRIVAIDSSGFNFRYLLPFAKAHFPEIPLIYYIVPKLWAWRSGRIKVLKRYCTELLVILPFEEAYFKTRGIPTTYVGNPSADSMDSLLATHGNEDSLQAFFSRHQEIPQEKPLIALLPGSRKQEIKDNLPLMLRTVSQHFPEYTAVIAQARGREKDEYSKFLKEYPHTYLLPDDTYGILATAKMAVVTSGTATLEAALIGVPQVVCYRFRATRLVNWLFLKLFHIPFFSLVNIIAQKKVVDELLAADATEENLRKSLEKLLTDEEAIQQGYREVRLKLGKKNASQNAAEAIIHAKGSEL